MNYKYKILACIIIILSFVFLSDCKLAKKQLSSKNHIYLKQTKSIIPYSAYKLPLLLIPIPMDNSAPIKVIFYDTHKVSYIKYYNADCIRWSKNYKHLYMTGDKLGIMKCEYDSNTRSFGSLIHIHGTSKLGNINGFDISPDESIIITADDDHGVRLFDIKTQNILTIINHNIFKSGNLQCISFSPKGNYICFTAQSKVIMDENTGNHYQDLWIAKNDGSYMKKLGYGLIPEWYSDNHHILTTVGYGEKLLLYNIYNNTSKIIWRAKLGSINIDSATIFPNTTDILIDGPYTNGGGSFVRGKNNCGYFLLNPAKLKIKKLPWLDDITDGYTINYTFPVSD